MKPTIGILGGMGPRATVQFEHMLLERLQGGDQNIPTIITINDGSIPDRSAFLVNGGADPLPRMQRNLLALELLGAHIVCVPCNTACAPAIFGRLQPASSKVIDLPQEVGGVLHQQKLHRVFILATEGTIALGTYQTVCLDSNVEYIVPSTRTQRFVTNVVNAVKQNDPRAKQAAAHVARAIKTSGCDGAILGCTELPLVKEFLVPENCAAIDTLAVLADACVRYTQTNQRSKI